MLKSIALIGLIGLVSVASARRPVRTYEIDLDKAPEDRYVEIISDTSNGFNATVWGFWEKFFANDKALTDALYAIADARMHKEDAELLGEVKGLAAHSGLPLKFVYAIQFLYELQTLMVPIVNVTGAPPQYPIPQGWEALSRIPWRGPGCTGIIAVTEDGSVSHARDLDFSPVPYMTKLVYTGIFKKNGVEVFRSQLVAGYVAIITGMRMGKNGWTIERNTRYPDHEGGNEVMFKNILDGRISNGWQLRKVLESQPEYEGAVAAISAAPYISTEYSIISGVRKGTILSRDPNSVYYTQTLGQPNFDERSDYIIITNFDFFDHDIREYFDPTGGKVGHPRRIAAQELLNSTSPLTSEFLFETINAKGVIADTIFQAVMNVEHSLWNVSQPDL